MRRETIEMPLEIAFEALSDRDAIRLLARMAKRFNNCSYSYDKLESGIEECAAILAEEEGWRPDAFCLNDSANLAERFLAEPWPRTGIAPTINLSGARNFGGRHGG